VNGHDQPARNQPPLTAEPVTVEKPKHPLHALTTYELARYRRELEHALKTLPGHAEVRTLLQQRLTEALTEQQARTQLQQASRTGTTG
jgi:hypothetical protein